MATPAELAQLVFFVRGERVMLDVDLAKLYGVQTKALNQAMSRNEDRFPGDFAFRLTHKELDGLISQIVISLKGPPGMWSQIVTTSQKRRRLDALPYAFTEEGVAMLSSVLRSQRAVEVNIAIMRTFVQLRRLMDSIAIWREGSPLWRRDMMSNSRKSLPQLNSSSRHPENELAFIHSVPFDTALRRRMLNV